MCMALPAKILSVVDRKRKTVLVDCMGRLTTLSALPVATASQPLDDLAGAWVLVHQGFAMTRITEADAEGLIDALNTVGVAAPDRSREGSGCRTTTISASR